MVLIASSGATGPDLELFDRRAALVRLGCREGAYGGRLAQGLEAGLDRLTGARVEALGCCEGPDDAREFLATELGS